MSQTRRAGRDRSGAPGRGGRRSGRGPGSDRGGLRRRRAGSRRDHADRGDQDLPRHGRARAGRTSGSATSVRAGTRRPPRRPRTAPDSGCAGTSSGGCSGTRRGRWLATPTSCTPLDRIEVVTALGRAARAAGRELGCLVQVSLDGDPARGGVPAPDLPGAGRRGRRRGGPGAARASWRWPRSASDPMAAFAALPELSEQVRRDHPGPA